MISFVISCKKAAELASASLDRPLSLAEKLQWRFHLTMCAACRVFRKQNEALARLFEMRFRIAETGPHMLPPDASDKLRRRLREAAGDQASSD